MSAIFYILIILILAAAVLLFIYRKSLQKKNRIKTTLPEVNLGLSNFTTADNLGEESPLLRVARQSPYDPNFIVLHLNAFPGRPYIGYELHQALLAANLRFGEMNIFHRYDDGEKANVLFSIAAATPSGVFNVEDLGAFKCDGLLAFLRLDKGKKLMTSFDLMLDTARQLIEELGGEIYDDLQQSLNANVIKRLREKICQVETHNLYSADLLDNLD